MEDGEKRGGYLSIDIIELIDTTFFKYCSFLPAKNFFPLPRDLSSSVLLLQNVPRKFNILVLLVLAPSMYYIEKRR